MERKISVQIDFVTLLNLHQAASGWMEQQRALLNISLAAKIDLPKIQLMTIASIHKAVQDSGKLLSDLRNTISMDEAKEALETNALEVAKAIRKSNEGENTFNRDRTQP